MPRRMLGQSQAKDMLSHPAKPSQERAQCRHVCSLQTLCPLGGSTRCEKEKRARIRDMGSSPRGVTTLGVKQKRRKRGESGGRTSKVRGRPAGGRPPHIQAGGCANAPFNSNRCLLCVKIP